MNKYLLSVIALLFCVVESTVYAQNVGIGNPAPLHKLDVSGDINLTGTLRVNGSAGSAGQVLTRTGSGLSWATPSGGISGVTASNGLNATVGSTPDIRLGGSLTGNTTINVGNNVLNLTGGQSKVAIGEGAQIETGGNRSVALGSQARVNGSESVAIGIGNTGTSTVARAGSYSLAIGQDIGANNGANGSPVIAIGSGFTNSETGSIMIGSGSLVPSLTLVEGSGSTPGNVGIGTTDPVDLLHLRGTQLNIRLQNTTPTTGNTYQLNSTNAGNFRIVNQSDGLIPLDIDAAGNVGIGDALAISGANVNLGTDARAGRFEFDNSTGFEPISGTWTSMDVYGSKNNYSGFNFKDVSRYLMVNGVYQGIHTGSSWQWRFDNGTLNIGTIPWARISGEPATYAPSAHTHSAGDITSGTLPVNRGGTGSTSHTSGRILTGNGTGAIQSTLQYSSVAGGNTLVQRHPSGYIFSNYINTTDNAVSTGVTGVMVKQGNDYHRTANASAVRSFLGLGTMATQNSNAVNITGGTVQGSTISGDISGNAGGIVVNRPGYIANEITGSSGVYFDLKDNAADDFDVRMIYYSNSAFDIINRTGGVRLNQNAGSWASLSDSTKKTDFNNIDELVVLDKIQEMELGSWRYKFSDNNDRHYGPMAQDFYAAFGQDEIGNIGNDTTINTLDIDGVMMIAIQGLINENDALKKKVAQLEMINKQEIETLSAELKALNQKIENYSSTNSYQVLNQK